MEWLLWTILGLAGFVAAVIVLGTLWAIVRPGFTLKFSDKIFYFWGRWYTRVVHRLRVEGIENLPRTGAVLVVANHTAGVDPVLIGAPSRRPIRWIMATDMRLGAMEWFWRWQRIIFVGRDAKPDSKDTSTTGLRTAMDELKAGGAVGIFPEGGLERPAEQVLPFQPGVGLMIKKAKVPVVPVWVSGTPQVDPAWASLWNFSRSRVVYGEPIDFSSGRKMSATEIADDLRGWMLKTSGWPANDDPKSPRVATDNENPDSPEPSTA